jgi:DNA-binding MarR family transcriptional regulator
LEIETMDDKKLELFRGKIRIIERELQRQLKDDTTCCGVSLAQCHVLMELGLAGTASISHLAEILKLDKSTLSRTIDGMVRIGLVDRSIDERDRRYMVVKLTEQGNKLYTQINASCNNFYQQLFRHIPAAKHNSVISSIGFFADAFAKTCEEKGPECSIDFGCIPEKEKIK